MTTKTMGQLLKQLAEADAKLATANAAAAAAKDEFEAMRDEVIEAMKDQGTDILQAAGLTVRLGKKIIYSVKNWDDFYKILLRHKAPHLLQRRLSEKAFDEFVQQELKGRLPASCGTFEKESLSITRS